MDDRTIKNYILISDLGGGGAERQVSHIMHLEEVTKVFLLYPTIVYNVPQHKVECLFPNFHQPGLWQKIQLFFLLPGRLKKAGLKPGDQLFCFLQIAYLLGLWCKFLLGIKFITCLRTSPFGFYENFKGLKIPKFLFKFILKQAKEVIINSKQSGTELRTRWKLDNVRIIENGYDYALITKQAQEVDLVPDFFASFNTFITVGRLVHDKGQWHLIRIFAELKKERSDLKFIIAGQGPLLEPLTNLCHLYGLKVFRSDHNESLNASFDIYFIGFQKNPYSWIRRCKLFLLSSLYEGLPNVLIESLLLEVPVISSDCKSGPREILFTHNEALPETLAKPAHSSYGILMPPFTGEENFTTSALHSVEQFWFQEIKSLLDHPLQLQAMMMSSKDIQSRYGLKPILAFWRKAFS